MKYFNFLLENDINFKRDETGNFTALVKVFNPEYYKEKEKLKNSQNKNKHFENEPDDNPINPRLIRSASANSKLIILNKNSKNENQQINEKENKKVFHKF